MFPNLAAFLRQHTPVAEEWPIWTNGESENAVGSLLLQERTYLSSQLPPDEVVSSVRAILFRGNEVMVITDHQGDAYVVPGGRRERGESLTAALQRELLEETGWHVADTAVLGFIHFHHLSPKPDGYLYPYPDFVQVVYTAVAKSYEATAISPDPYVTSTRFCSVQKVLTLNLSAGQTALLQAAITQRATRS